MLRLGLALLAILVGACAVSQEDDELQLDAMGGAVEGPARALQAGVLSLGATGGAVGEAHALHTAGVHAAAAGEGGQLAARALQAGVLTMEIPAAGSLGPISGRLTLLPVGPAALPTQYKFCVYLEAYDRQVAVYNGPKPAEDADSYTQIAPDGSFTFTQWWANAALDPVTPFVSGYAFPSALGNCLPILGTPASANFPAGMNRLSVAHVTLPRVNTLSLRLAAGHPSYSDDANGTFVLTILGSPPNPIAFQILVFTSADGGATLTGPAPACSALASFTPDFSGTVTIPLGGALAGVADVYFVLVAAALAISPTPQMYLGEVTGPVVCVAALAPLQGEALPPPLPGLQLALLRLQRAPRPPPPPPASPSPSPSPTPSRSGTHTPSPRPTTTAGDLTIVINRLDISAGQGVSPTLWAALAAACASVAAAFGQL